MSEIKHTSGPYERIGATIFALQHYGWRKGEEQFCNRIYANVQTGPGCSQEEAEAVAALFQAAPDLFEAASKALALIELCIDGDMEPSDEAEALRAAIAKATGSQS